MRNISIFTDGGSRGNPGQAGIGVYIKDDERTITQIGKRIGVETNNVAEYKAVIEALTWISENKENLEDTSINFFMDSQLIYSQIVGLYKIKNEILRSLLYKVREKEAEIKLPISYNYIPREQNKNADGLVNMALDNIL
ncbi:MAG TPA: ribonuclease HI family protein [Patescibacteria group bacterium]|nr:ribonuclease HI family protein [Patescibacteria group bacterium]